MARSSSAICSVNNALDIFISIAFFIVQPKSDVEIPLCSLWPVRINNSTFERVEEFKYLGTTLTHQNSIAEEIKSRLRLGNACYHSVQNILSSRLLSKNLNFKIYRTIIL